jgi:hypothetical protein
MKRTLIIICSLLAVSLMWGCFKDVVDYTVYNTAIYEQTTTDGSFKPATDVDTYAYWVDTTQWTIKSWDDAVARRITNKLTGETREMPDAYGSFNASDEYQSSIRLDKKVSMIVMVCPETRIYAYRKYDLPDNLAEVNTKFYITSWRASHSSAGWRVVNQFYTPPAKE